MVVGFYLIISCCNVEDDISSSGYKQPSIPAHHPCSDRWEGSTLMDHDLHADAEVKGTAAQPSRAGSTRTEMWCAMFPSPFCKPWIVTIRLIWHVRRTKRPLTNKDPRLFWGALRACPMLGKCDTGPEVPRLEAQVR